jgi:DNA-binding transcriptional ArsR family regulator
MADEAGHPDVSEMELGTILSVLSDRHRRDVVTTLALEDDSIERTCASFNLPVSKSSLTYHFRLLRESGLIWDLDYGNRKSVKLRRADLDERFPGLLDLLTSEAAAGVHAK